MAGGAVTHDSAAWAFKRANEDLECDVARGRREVKLLLCPFCGSKAVACDRVNGLNYATCGDCLADGPRSLAAVSAIAAWNTLRGRGVPEAMDACHTVLEVIRVLDVEDDVRKQYRLGKPTIDKLRAALAKWKGATHAK